MQYTVGSKGIAVVKDVPQTVGGLGEALAGLVERGVPGTAVVSVLEAGGGHGYTLAAEWPVVPA